MVLAPHKILMFLKIYVHKHFSLSQKKKKQAFFYPCCYSHSSANSYANTVMYFAYSFLTGQE